MNLHLRYFEPIYCVSFRWMVDFSITFLLLNDKIVIDFLCFIVPFWKYEAMNSWLPSQIAYVYLLTDADSLLKLKKKTDRERTQDKYSPKQSPLFLVVVVVVVVAVAVVLFYWLVWSNTKENKNHLAIWISSGFYVVSVFWGYIIITSIFKS